MDKLDIRIIDILDRLEDAKKVLGMGDDLEEAIRKLQRGDYCKLDSIFSFKGIILS